MTAVLSPGLVGAAPALTKPRKARPFTVAERTLDNGLRVLVVRRAGVPLVELRLRVPFSGRAVSQSAKASVLSETLLSGTADHSALDIAIALQEIGGALNVSTDPDRLMVSGNALASGLPRLLELLAEVLNTATYPAEEAVGERDRMIERLRIARAQPSVIASEALLHRMFGEHPYARQIPEPDAVAAVTAAQLRSLHSQRVVPAGSTLVVVGDLSPQRALDRVEAELSTWDRPGRAQAAPKLPDLEAGPIVLVDRPGAVQSNLRLGGRALPRQDPGYPAMQLANLVFGGYFSSRLVENIREEKGYTYSPHCVIDHSAAGSSLLLEADVATEVTAPALLEVRYELGRMATLPVTDDELASARQYAIGTLALSIATQSGLASTLSALVASGLGPDWLREHPLRLAGVTIDDVAQQAAAYLAPTKLVTVVVGDSANVRSTLSTLDEVAEGVIPKPALSRVSYDRAAHHRTDEDWLTDAWRSAAILVLGPDGTVQVEGTRDTPRLAFAGADEVSESVDHVFLGEDEKLSYFAVFSDRPPDGGLGLRQIGALLDDQDAGLLVTAVALANWHRTHTHCPRCGRPTVISGAGWLRTCPSDGSEHFPRVDPAVIMLVHDGADRCLLGRQASWPEGRFSTLAGFVEPGESLEHAVAREVAEEAGIAVADIRYRASQPWPFPSSLMLGFTARAVSADEPRLLDGELAEARWFTRAELAADAGPKLPPPISISQWLIATWLQATPEPLS